MGCCAAAVHRGNIFTTHLNCTLRKSHRTKDAPQTVRKLPLSHLYHFSGKDVFYTIISVIILAAIH